MTNPVYYTKILAAASSTGIGSLSTASPGVATLNTSNLDTQRRIIIWSTGATLASATFTIQGTREGGANASPTSVRETITGPTNVSAVTTTQDFLSVTSVSASSVINAPATFGTNTQGGTPWQSVNLNITPCQIGAALIFSSTQNSMAASVEYTYDNPFAYGQFGSVNSAPGGLAQPLNAVVQVFTSTAFSSVTGPTAGSINVSGPVQMPIAAWRVTLTASSTGAGNVNVSAIQAGIG